MSSVSHELPSRSSIVDELMKRYAAQIGNITANPSLVNADMLGKTNRVHDIIAALLLKEDQIVEKSRRIAVFHFGVLPMSTRKGDFLVLDRTLVTWVGLPPMLLYEVAYRENIGPAEYNNWASQYFIKEEDARIAFELRSRSTSPELGVQVKNEYFVNDEHRRHTASFRTTEGEPGDEEFTLSDAELDSVRTFLKANFSPTTLMIIRNDYRQGANSRVRERLFNSTVDIFGSTMAAVHQKIQKYDKHNCCIPPSVAKVLHELVLASEATSND